MSTAEEAFLALVNQHQAAIRRVCRTYASASKDREEIFQEIMLSTLAIVRVLSGRVVAGDLGLPRRAEHGHHGSSKRDSTASARAAGPRARARGARVDTR